MRKGHHIWVYISKEESTCHNVFFSSNSLSPYMRCLSRGRERKKVMSPKVSLEDGDEEGEILAARPGGPTRG